MALVVRHNRATHTHENEQFRRVASSLKLLFKQKGWIGLLIGNPFNEKYSRFRADAILLYEHGFIIIDFKAYRGTLKLPGNKDEFEMSQWYTESDEDKSRTAVKAGNRFINPFKQLNSYREAFKEIVRNEIRLKNLIQESKTCALNIFSGPLTIQNSVPREIPFYKITQESDLGTFLYDYSSDNTYSKESADALTGIFNAEEWLEHIEMPFGKSIFERTVEIENDVQQAISEFLKTGESGILVLESISTQERDDWVQYVLNEALDFNIPQIETWIHSARIGRKVSARLGIELQSLFNTIYGGAPTIDIDHAEEEDAEFEEQLVEIIPIRSDDSIDQSAVIILHEAHLVTRSLHQSDLLRFGSGRLLEDLLNFLSLENTKRKLICVGDPYSLTYGKDTECAISLDALSELFDKAINHYRRIPDTVSASGKVNLRTQLANGIENKRFNSLEYPWINSELLEIEKDNIPKYLSEWFNRPLDSEPTNTVLVYSNKDAKKINQWVKNYCLKNGKDLAPQDLLLLNNNVNIPDESGFGQPTKLYNGMFLLVEEVIETISKTIRLRQSTAPIMLQFTKLKVKCLSLKNKLITEVWLLNNYFQSDDQLSKEEQIAFRVFVNMLVADKMKDQKFEDSNDNIQFKQDKEYKTLLNEEKELKRRSEAGENVKTKLGQAQKQIRKIENKYKKRFKNKILSAITQTDLFVNSIRASYGWSITVHKGIGSTFANVILNAYRGENQGITNIDYFRWLYSGTTTCSGLLRIANPQNIHPLMDVHFEDTNVTGVVPVATKRSFLSFPNYMGDQRFLEKLSKDLNENVLGSICELAKIVEPKGYLLKAALRSGEYLTKAVFSIPHSVQNNMSIAIDNKGAKDDYVVSFIRIENANGADKEFMNDAIEHLFLSRKAEFPTDFRGPVYSQWETILKDRGYSLTIIESHSYQDILKIGNGVSIARVKVWYNSDGFFTKIVVMEKTDDAIGNSIKKWLLNGN